MASSEATRARLQITRAGLVTRGGAERLLSRATHYAPRFWGFSDGSVLVWLGERARIGINNPTPVQISRRTWKAFNLR